MKKNIPALERVAPQKNPLSLYLSIFFDAKDIIFPLLRKTNTDIIQTGILPWQMGLLYTRKYMDVFQSKERERKIMQQENIVRTDGSISRREKHVKRLVHRCRTKAQHSYASCFKIQTITLGQAEHREKRIQYHVPGRINTRSPSVASLFGA